MKKVLFFVSLLILTTINVIAQKWVVKNYLDDFGDPSGKKYIKQTIEGVHVSEKINIKVSLDMPQSEYFIFRINNNKTSTRQLLESIGRYDSNDTFLFRYKIGSTESSFNIDAPYLLIVLWYNLYSHLFS